MKLLPYLVFCVILAAPMCTAQRYFRPFNGTFYPQCDTKGWKDFGDDALGDLLTPITAAANDYLRNDGKPKSTCVMRAGLQNTYMYVEILKACVMKDPIYPEADSFLYATTSDLHLHCTTVGGHGTRVDERVHFSIEFRREYRDNAYQPLEVYYSHAAFDK